MVGTLGGAEGSASTRRGPQPVDGRVDGLGTARRVPVDDRCTALGTSWGQPSQRAVTSRNVVHRLWTQESSSRELQDRRSGATCRASPRARGPGPSDPAASLSTHGRSAAPAAQLAAPPYGLTSRCAAAPGGGAPSAPIGRTAARSCWCPARMSRAEEARWVATMVERLARQERRSRPSDAELLARAGELSRRWLGGRARPASVRWSSNQRRRWGSCTSTDGHDPALDAGCRACRRGSSTTSCSTSSPTCSRPATGRSSGRCSSATRRSRALGPSSTGSPGRTVTRPLSDEPPDRRGASPPRPARQRPAPNAVVGLGQRVDVAPGTSSDSALAWAAHRRAATATYCTSRWSPGSPARQGAGCRSSRTGPAPSRRRSSMPLSSLASRSAASADRTVAGLEVPAELQPAPGPCDAGRAGPGCGPR